MLHVTLAFVALNPFCAPDAVRALPGMNPSVLGAGAGAGRRARIGAGPTISAETDGIRSLGASRESWGRAELLDLLVKPSIGRLSTVDRPVENVPELDGRVHP